MPNTKTSSLIGAEVNNNNNHNSVNNKVIMIIANVNGHLLSARYMSPFTLHDLLYVKTIVMLILILEWGNQNLGSLSNMSWVTELDDIAGVESQAF